MAVTKQDLETYYKLDQQRLKHDKAARAAKEERDKIGNRIAAELKKTKKKTLKRGTIRASLENCQVRVQWKDELRKVIGEKKMAALASKAGTTTRLVVTNEN